jgi:adenosine kinase
LREFVKVDIVLTGSVAFDYLMTFPGYFRDHILPDHLEKISLSFLVDSMERRRGGIAPNIAYTLALMGERPRLWATVG